jgi:hypothetical protein
VANGGALPWMNHTDHEICRIKTEMLPEDICAELSEHHANGWSAVLDRLYAMKANDAPDYDAIASQL